MFHLISWQGSYHILTDFCINNQSNRINKRFVKHVCIVRF